MSRIAAARALRDLSAVDLATAAGVAPSMLSTYERGHVTPSIDVLIRIADALDVDVDYLCGRRDEPRLDGPQAAGLVADIRLLTAPQKRLVARFIAFVRDGQRQPAGSAIDRLHRGIAARQSN